MDILNIIIVTLKISLLATFICFISSLILSYLSIKFTKLTFFIDIVTTIPLALPPVITGYFLIFISNGNIAFEWIGGSFACAIIALPLVYRTILITFNSIDSSLINTSRILGANKKRTFFYVIFPVIKTGIFSAIFLGFIRSISEFGATMIVSGNISGKTQTLSTAIYTSIQNGNTSKLIQLSSVSIFLAVITVIIFNFIRKKHNYNNFL
jgi:molybdate transport system permease protein|tara:strand:+ start:17328 stop:17957 length:630 start_codon:yes stop_codon:yes gene_type:complete